MPTDVTVPVLGESITEATLGAWLKNPGDAVAADQPIASLETDKVAVEVNAPVAGTLAKQLVNEGDTVAVGSVIALIAEGAASGAAAAPVKEAVDAATNPPGPAETPLPKEDAHAPTEEHADLTLSPAVRRAVLEHHVDPSKISGTGKDGRITKDDVLAAAQAKDGAAPAPVHEPEARAPAKPDAPPRGPRRRRQTEGRTRQDVALAADCRSPAQGGAEHRRAAHHLQRCRHVGGDRRPRPLQGPVREEARHPPRLHGLLRQSRGARRPRRAVGQRQHRGRRDRLPRLPS